MHWISRFCGVFSTKYCSMCFTYLSNSSVKVLLDAFVKHIFRCSQFDFIILLEVVGGRKCYKGPDRALAINKKGMRGRFHLSGSLKRFVHIIVTFVEQFCSQLLITGLLDLQSTSWHTIIEASLRNDSDHRLSLKPTMRWSTWQIRVEFHH